MSLLGIIALITGALGVFLTIKQTIWCWPFALISVITSIVEFYKERLFGDMALQIFYFFAGVYGWIYWNQKKNEVFLVKKMKLHFIPLYISVTLAQTVLYYYLILYFNGDRPMLDAFLTACSLTTTYLMTKKYVENWIIWVFIDATYIVLYGLKEMWLFAVLNLIFTVIAFYGWLKWRKEVA